MRYELTFLRIFLPVFLFGNISSPALLIVPTDKLQIWGILGLKVSSIEETLYFTGSGRF